VGLLQRSRRPHARTLLLPGRAAAVLHRLDPGCAAVPPACVQTTAPPHCTAWEGPHPPPRSHGRGLSPPLSLSLPLSPSLSPSLSRPARPRHNGSKGTAAVPFRHVRLGASRWPEGGGSRCVRLSWAAPCDGMAAIGVGLHAGAAAATRHQRNGSATRVLLLCVTSPSSRAARMDGCPLGWMDAL
jgi:hypothetical protein